VKKTARTKTTTKRAALKGKASRRGAARAGAAPRGEARRRGAQTAAARQPGRTGARRQATPTEARGRSTSPAHGAAGTETQGSLRRRTATILDRLERLYPDAKCSLEYANPLQLLVATILSAQCTDARVNQVTPALFARYPTARDVAAADIRDLEEMIRSTGFYHNKARNLIGCAQALMERHGGQVPADLDSLVALPGIGRKTANVVLGNAFGIPGLVVDTHVTRLANLLCLTGQEDPNKIETDLMEVVPREKWTELAHLFIQHGREVCVARRPRCGDCVLRDLCPSSAV